MWIVQQNSRTNVGKTHILVRKKNQIKEEQYGISQREYKVKKNRNIMKRTKRGISSKRNKEQKKERKKYLRSNKKTNTKRKKETKKKKFT